MTADVRFTDYRLLVTDYRQLVRCFLFLSRLGSIQKGKSAAFLNLSRTINRVIWFILFLLVCSHFRSVAEDSNPRSSGQPKSELWKVRLRF